MIVVPLALILLQQPQVQTSGKAAPYEVVTAVRMVLYTVSLLNTVSDCISCPPALSDQNTFIATGLLNNAITEMRNTPERHKVIANGAIRNLLLALDDEGRRLLNPYIQAALTIIGPVIANGVQRKLRPDGTPEPDDQ